MSTARALPRLMLVTDRHRTSGRSLTSLVAEVAGAGCRLVQLREKDLDDESFERLVQSIRRSVESDALLLLNGRPSLASRIGAGLHLPANATPARAPVGFPTGRSVHDSEEARRAVEEGVDYLVFGNVWETASKPGRSGQGLGSLRSIVDVAGRVPVFAIGGVEAAQVPQALQAGAHGVAVCGALLEAAEPGRAAGELLEALRGWTSRD